MESLLILFFFLLGAIIGSFLNVVILRHNTGGGLFGRSHCFSCGKHIKWYDLIPVLSFLFLGGRCRFCKSKISPQYPLVELFTAVIFAATFLRFYPSLSLLTFSSAQCFLFLITLAVMSTLVVITVYDLKHKIIPDIFVAIFSVLALIKIFISVPSSILFHYPSIVLYLLSGPIIALPFVFLWLVSRGRWIGFGDAKLALGIGWFLGLVPAVSSVIIGFWIGAIVSVVMLVVGWLYRNGHTRGIFLLLGIKTLSLQSEVPLAPFLVLGFLIVYFFNIDVLGLSILITR